MRTIHRSLWVASAIAFSRTERTAAYFSHSPLVLSRSPGAAFAAITQRSQSQRSSRSSTHRIRQPTHSPTQFNAGRETPSDFTIDDDNENEELAGVGKQQRDASASRPSHPRRPPIRAVISAGESSWMDRNAQFRGETPRTQPKQQRATESSFQPSRGGNNSNNSRRRDDDWNRQSTTRERTTTTTNNYNRAAPAPRNAAPLATGGGPPKSFREDFRGSRVFVSGLPEDCSWQTLKDHFRVAGEVVFASVSLDRTTGRSKGHGIVQFETTDQATNAITIMRNHPLQEHKLFVRPDVQENTITDPSETGEDRLLQLMEERKKGPTPPSKWKCANSQDDAAALFANGERHRAILQTLKARDQARIRRNYAAADTMRDELKREYGVHIDDRHHLWWTSAENQVPESIRDLNGEGRWGAAPAWRWIPSTPESDACVDPDLVEGLLKQRDVARREKDFATADRLLEQARIAPDNDLTLRIHDESRTWRIWTSEPPPAAMMTNRNNDNRMTNYNSRMTIDNRMTNYNSDGDDDVDEEDEEEDRRVSKQQSPVEQCLEIVGEHEPEKLNELRTLLAKFPGREYNILKKIKQRYYYEE